MRVLVVTNEWPSEVNPENGSFVRRQVQFLRQAGIDVEVFPFEGAQSIRRYMQAFWQLRKLLQNNPVDLIHAQFGQSGALAALTRHAPLVVTFRGSDVFGIFGAHGRYTLAGFFLRMLSRFAAKRADEAIIVSHSMRNYLPNRHYHILPSGIDLNLFTPINKKDARQRLGLAQNKTIILFGGNPEKPVKRFNLAQETIEILKQKRSVELLTVTKKPHASMPLYMSAADALLLTSVHEGSPNVVKEALACNLPIVSVDVGDVKERIADVKGSSVCIEASAKNLAEALENILTRTQPVVSRSAVIPLDEKNLTSDLIGIYQLAKAGRFHISPSS